MLVKSVPGAVVKLGELGDATRFEPVGDRPQAERVAPSHAGKDVRSCISQVTTPRGKKPVLKAMMTTACEANCFYCPFRAGREYRRTTFRPEEMAAAFDEVQRSGLVQGLFLSSGVAGGGPRTQDRLLETAAILRERYKYQGYVHLKVMPGAEYDQVARAMQLADRVSVNLEAPNARRLKSLAPQKDFQADLLERLGWAHDIRQRGQAKASLTTQFVMGAVGESDLELLSTTQHLYRDLGLARAYYQAFSPVPDTPLDSLPRASALRERRLYQASFLLRDYGFEMEEMPFQADGHLPLDSDPKLAWARTHLSESPVDLMHADKRELLRVPGIGPKSAERILRARRRGALRDLHDLRNIGLRGVGRAAPFILLNGRRPTHQLPLL